MKASEYSYYLPEDYVLNPEIRAKLDAIVEASGISNEYAQKFLNLHVEIVEAMISSASIEDAGQEVVATEEGKP